MDFLEDRYPEAMELLDNAKDDILAVYDLPVHCRKKMRTTNMTERTNEEIRRRERVIRIFPNDASALMLAGAYLQELSEAWISHPSVHGHDGILESEGGTGTEGKGLSETASQHGSTRGRSGEYVTGSEFTAVLGLD